MRSRARFARPFPQKCALLREFCTFINTYWSTRIPRRQCVPRNHDGVDTSSPVFENARLLFRNGISVIMMRNRSSSHDAKETSWYSPTLRIRAGGKIVPAAMPGSRSSSSARNPTNNTAPAASAAAKHAAKKPTSSTSCRKGVFEEPRNELQVCNLNDNTRLAASHIGYLSGSVIFIVA